MAALTLARAYQHSFDAHPHITLAVTGGTLNALGDCVAQVSERSVRPRVLTFELVTHASPF
jgi:protein Mpv17